MNEIPFVITDRDPPIAIVSLNRPDILNALSLEMFSHLCIALETLDNEPDIRVIILTGNQRAFAAGADIKMLAQASPMDILRMDTLGYWQRIRRLKKPLIAAVSGYVYGGGCELALVCDLIVASETVLFAQPEIKVGIIPGGGGTQRLTKAIGPYRAMEMVLTGEPLSAQEAYNHGLINRLVPSEQLLDQAKELARLIASRPPLAVRLAREAVRFGAESTLRDGLEVERRNYTLLFDSQDQKEGMQAFLEKREAKFSGK